MPPIPEPRYRQADHPRLRARGIAKRLTRAELEEIFLTAIPYAGFQAAKVAKAAMQAAFDELDGK